MTINASTFEAFQADAQAAGFDEGLECRWAPDTGLDTHRHTFGVEAVITQGEMWLSCEGRTHYLIPQRFYLGASSGARRALLSRWRHLPVGAAQSALTGTWINHLQFTDGRGWPPHRSAFRLLVNSRNQSEGATPLKFADSVSLVRRPD